MALSDLKMYDIEETGFTSCDYKGFDISVDQSRGELKACIRVMPDPDSDFCLFIDDVMACSMGELKEEIQYTINRVVEMTGKQIIKMFKNGEITVIDHNTGKWCLTKDLPVETEENTQVIVSVDMLPISNLITCINTLNASPLSYTIEAGTTGQCVLVFDYMTDKQRDILTELLDMNCITHEMS